MQQLRKFIAFGWLALACAGLLVIGAESRPLQAQSASGRKVKSKVDPMYPDIARKMGISGVVKMKVVVAASGTLKDAKVVGGHPVLANAAMDAVRKWKFEPASSESTETIEVTFAPQQ